MTSERASLEGLPDELLLGILFHLRTIRSFGIYSPTFDESKEKARQQENRLRQLSLSNLCRTSRHLNRLTIPALYAAFTGSSTWPGIGSLRRFHQEITAPRGSLGGDSTYASHLQYVENRFSDYQGNDHFANLDDPSDLYMLKEYFSLLAGIINAAPNLQHISVANVETSDVSFLKHVLREDSAGTSGCTIVADHGLSRLQTLFVEMEMDEEWGLRKLREASIYSIYSALASLPSLSDFRVAGARMTPTIGPKVNVGQFRNLQRLEITHCLMEMSQMNIILSACEGLRHIVCHWEWLESDKTVDVLRPGLRKHSHTLETLSLDFRGVQWMSESYGNSGSIGSLRQFDHLHTLEITDTYFLTRFEYGPNGHYRAPTSKVAELLPLSLKMLNLFVDIADSPGFANSLDDSDSLWDLSAACNSSLINLSAITVEGIGPNDNIETLMSSFEQAGVLCEFIVD
ncbi:hypothetical protein COCMIDRAFT_2151 [Bipolaris oryzae ATCC 44560]|uniref:Leucine-rich repeat domain-containing protein n=1 Tax=Bipolaris oryzae ATCC 44560 TaxID=930090 RepID=W6ZGR5_COCMI|nr:uncharacterized protein COCMIDRAFT_2151 [Bipolaris oryzae ATCC 44560]EUC49088.1 hypothetical protein COCMIDRAFT_2151 [Bipolaris oryzae ATCC 44560]